RPDRCGVAGDPLEAGAGHADRPACLLLGFAHLLAAGVPDVHAGAPGDGDPRCLPRSVGGAAGLGDLTEEGVRGAREPGEGGGVMFRWPTWMRRGLCRDEGKISQWVRRPSTTL